jgi:outer membrane lipoprotein carrier protein
MILRSVARAAPAALFLFLAAAPSRGGEVDAEALLLRVSKRHAAVRSLSAEFRQEVPLQNVGIVRRAQGRLYFERPLKMRWDYREPDAQLFLSDGEHFYFRPPGSGQVFRRRIDESALGGRVPLLLLFGKGEISDFFAARDAVPLKGGEEIALRLVPRGEAAGEVRRVDLVVGAEDALIREVHLYDRLGGANHLFLEGTQIDPDLPPRLFRFRKDPGIEVVDE